MRRKISNLGRADDIRKKYRDAMRDERFKFPRNNMLSHSVGWYLDGHLISRPLTAVYAFANLAEYMLYYARHGRRGQRGAETAAVEFFAETRRAMQNVLSSYPLDRRLRQNERESVGKVAIRLCDHAKITWDELAQRRRCATALRAEARGNCTAWTPNCSRPSSGSSRGTVRYLRRANFFDRTRLTTHRARWYNVRRFQKKGDTQCHQVKIRVTSTRVNKGRR